MNTVQQFGVHLMIDAYHADPQTLDDKAALTTLLHDIPVKMGMHTISDPLVVRVGEKNVKDPGGLSGFVLIAESHISFHTFPKRKFVTIDVYTCQNDLDTEKFITLFREYFKFTDEDTYLQKRGLRYPANNF